MFAVEPEWIVHDLHPDYASTRYAVRRQAEQGLKRLAVQHHHAHMASCMAEHGLSGPVIGISFDGTGYGTDGAVWGGEFLVGDYQRFHRAAHLRYVGLPGGDQAIREPWRMAASHLIDAGQEPAALFGDRIPDSSMRMIQTMLQRRLNSPLTSSAGRLFDAVASLAGVRDRVSYEGQAAVQLEWLAMQAPAGGAYPFDLEGVREPQTAVPAWIIDTRPMIRAIAQDAIKRCPAPHIARRFHSTLARMGVAVCNRLRETMGVDVVVLSGGVFMNALLATELSDHLAQEGFRVYRHRLVPPNDGGLSLGQLAVAAHRLMVPEVRSPTGDTECALESPAK